MTEGKHYSYNGQHVTVFPDGRVVGDRKELSQRCDQDGYWCVTLGHPRKGGRSRCRVHKLVADLFLNNPDNLETVDHIDGDKENNNYTNLQWMTRIDNVKKGLSRPVIAVSLKCPSFGMWFPSQGDAARRFKLTSNANIHQAVTKKRPTCQGFAWRKVI